ncbi:MAG: TolC family protein, partial [Alistipes sp.]|nr:TolC family protein [Alistipes sp.]
YQIAMARNDIEIAVTQAYLNILYANESVKINRQTVETSLAQRDRSKVLLEAGSISPSDFAQMESQYSSDKYQLTVSENLLAQRTLVLRQLLELELEDRFAIDFPELSEGEVLASIPELASAYRDALEVMPQIDNSAANIRSAQVNEQIAKAAGLPSLTASAAIGTGNISGTNYSFYNQLNHKLNENIGLTLSVPIFNNRRAKTSIAKARLQTKQAEIEHQSVEKELLSTIESLYQDAVSAQSRYISATDKVHAATVSYQLVSEQFNAGMKNTVELLTEKNTYLSAQLEQTQAKYQAVLSIKLLNFYRNQPINL